MNKKPVPAYLKDKTHHAEIFVGKDGDKWWHIKSTRNGKIVACSGEGYKRYESCKRALSKLETAFKMGKVYFGLMALAIVLLTGCKATLQPGGAYAPTNAITGQVQSDLNLYLVDSGFATSYATMDAMFNFERDNRTTLWKLNPNIKHAFDSVRPAAWKVVTSYTTARAAYIANPVPANLTGLQKIVAEVQQIVTVLTAALPSYTIPTTN